MNESMNDLYFVVYLLCASALLNDCICRTWQSVAWIEFLSEHVAILVCVCVFVCLFVFSFIY